MCGSSPSSGRGARVGFLRLGLALGLVALAQVAALLEGDLEPVDPGALDLEDVEAHAVVADVVAGRVMQDEIRVELDERLLANVNTLADLAGTEGG